jgi:hypothetical protein
MVGYSEVGPRHRRLLLPCRLVLINERGGRSRGSGPATAERWVSVVEPQGRTAGPALHSCLLHSAYCPLVEWRGKRAATGHCRAEARRYFCDMGTPFHSRLLPSPLWGRGRTPMRSICIGAGEGVKHRCKPPRSSRLTRKGIWQCPCNAQHLLYEQLRRRENHPVRKSRHRVSHPREMRVAHRVAFGLARLPVHAAVQFDDEAPLGAAKINDVLAQGVLPAKLESLQPEVSQQAPSGLFRCGLRLTKVARPGDLHWPTCQRSVSANTYGSFRFHGLHPLTRRLRATLSPKGARGSYPGPRPRPRPVPQRGEGWNACGCPAAVTENNSHFLLDRA